jgi:hypothetical protein
MFLDSQNAMLAELRALVAQHGGDFIFVRSCPHLTTAALATTTPSTRPTAPTTPPDRGGIVPPGQDRDDF